VCSLWPMQLDQLGQSTQCKKSNALLTLYLLTLQINKWVSQIIKDGDTREIPYFVSLMQATWLNFIAL
jgi:hypothetical protein